ncbi:S-adenosyl-L-methionine-dependent methyltransferase [Amylostereum chailletii]|nr:S-adenosyl-L-methionine-dependent methyltransferase [Amylostereum chailletii]
MTALRTATEIASLSLQPPSSPPTIQLQSTEHRLALLAPLFSSSTLKPGAKILEIGCGQGDASAVLAELVGEGGHVTGVDPGPLDYGDPYTLGEAQAHLVAGPLGPRLTFVQADPIAFLESSPTTYDAVVLVLCLWYFPSPQVIRDTLAAAARRAPTVFVAEWALEGPEGQSAHVLAALAQAALEAHSPSPSSNIRIAVSPAKIRQLAKEAGMKVEKEATVKAGETVLDGKWEVGEVLGEEFVERINDLVKGEKERDAVLALRDATVASVKRVGGGKAVKSMDVYCATLVKAE